MISLTRSEKLGLVYVLLAGVGFGFLGIFGRLAFANDLNVGELLTYRFMTAAALLWASLLLFKPRLIHLPAKQILISALLGSFGYAVFSTLYFMSIQGISVALAAILLFTFPLFVNLGSYFFLKETLSKNQWLSLALSFLGLIILVWGPLIVSSFHAVIYALLAAITYAAYVLLSGIWQRSVQPLSSSLYVISSAALALFIFHQPSLYRIADLNLLQFSIVLGIALISTIAPLTLFLAGLQRLTSSQASIVVMVEPVIAGLAAWVFLDESLSLNQLVGSALVLFSLKLATQKPRHSV